MAFNPSYGGHGGVSGGYGPPPTTQPQGYGAQLPSYSTTPGYAPPASQPPGYGAQPSSYGTTPGYAPPASQPPGYGAQPSSYSTTPGYGPGQMSGYPPSGGLPVYGSSGQRPPPTAPGGYMGPQGPPPGISPDLWNWFQSVDADRNGHITADELQRALMNGNWSPFNPETCRLMVGMFDVDGNGTIDIKEFAALWKYIQDWKSCFDRFDTDRSGNIDANELQNAFQTFGYNLSINFVHLCVRIFDRRCCRSVNFDDFIQCCVMMKTLTDRFREKDTKQSGVITVHYEEFLRMALDNKVV